MEPAPKPEQPPRQIGAGSWLAHDFPGAVFYDMAYETVKQVRGGWLVVPR